MVYQDYSSPSKYKPSTSPNPSPLKATPALHQNGSGSGSSGPTMSGSGIGPDFLSNLELKLNFGIFLFYINLQSFPFFVDSEY